MSNVTIDREAIAARKAELEKQHKQVYVIIVDDKVSYHRKPRLQEVSHCMSIMSKDIGEANRVLLASTYLEGDRDNFEVEDYLLTAMTVAQEMIQLKTVEILK